MTGSVYLPFGPRAQLTYGNGVTQTFTFNQRYLPYENKVASSAGTLSDVAYAENNLGEITQIDDLLSPQYNRTLTYGASTLPQSMLASVTTGAGLWGTATYAGQNGSYNVAGEDLSSEVLGNTSLAITYGGHDHLNGISTNGGTPVGASADSAGNTATLNGATYDLTLTPCGSPDLVVLDGPDGGTICTYPNATVSTGTYDIDESTLSLTSDQE